MSALDWEPFCRYIGQFVFVLLLREKSFPIVLVFSQTIVLIAWNQKQRHGKIILTMLTDAQAIVSVWSSVPAEVNYQLGHQSFTYKRIAELSEYISQ